MILTVIPARISSTRLPSKPLALIGNHPMLWWTWQVASASLLADKVVIATDDAEIREVMETYGAEVVMTSPDCQSGSDRVYNAAKAYPSARIIINLQGDEPLMPVSILDGTIETLLNHPEADLATPGIPFEEQADYLKESHVKVVSNQKGEALYFSRAPIAGALLHLGLYVYRKEALIRFCELPPSPLEKAERLEQMRALEDRMRIILYRTEYQDHPIFGIDTPEDLERARSLLI
ncbi:MAG: 3-deoxy-manno-octulosonate cytidylyltransferase [Candidatus Caenarcaniphilales bacterium]|nr:3-deoxy-manno-octulosonate cytidylyltransferase [Candidatus Caenarcaniphilales bacterium]